MLAGWVIAVMVIVPVLAVGLNVYVVKSWGAPEDAKGGALFPRAVIVLSLLLAECSVLLLPLDVAARSSSVFGNVGCGYWNADCGNDGDLVVVWYVLYTTIAVFVVLLIPFAILFYESWEYKLGDLGGNDVTSTCKEQCCAALRWQFVFTLVGAIVLVILYAAFGSLVSIPIYAYKAGPANTVEAPNLWTDYDPRAAFTTNQNFVAQGVGDGDLSEIVMPATFLIYLVACISWLGSWFFVIFAGVGLVILPFDNLRAWKDRPKQMDRAQLFQAEKQLVKRADELMEVAKMFKDDVLKARRQGAKRSKRADRKNFNKLKVGVHDLEGTADQLALCKEIMSDLKPTWANTLKPFFHLFMGVIGIVISLLWVLQVCLYILPRAVESAAGNPHSTAGILFLNDYLQTLDTHVPFFGVLTVAILVFWLQCCMIKGVFALGLRIFIIGIHPMKYGKTLASTFLVNVSIVLLSSPSLIAFCCEAFTSYTRSTDASIIFSVQIRYLSFFRPFYDMGIFTFTFLGFAVLAMLWVMVRGCCYKNGQRGVDEARFKKEMKKLEKAK